MDGMEGARKLVTAHLGEQLPAALATLRGRLGVGTEALPDFAHVGPSDRARLESDEWPACITVGVNLEGLRPADPGVDDVLVATFRYRMRSFVWGRGEDWAATADLRDRLMLGVREVLLGSPVLGPAGVVEPGGYREAYSDLDKDRSQVLAGAYAEYVVAVREIIPADPLARADTVHVTPLVPHPALED